MKVLKKKKLIFGVGINDADYVVAVWDKKPRSKIIWMCPFYVRWTEMLRRCYSERLHTKNPTYIGCTVIEDWLTFSNFKAWMETQDWEGKQLDKDLLIRGNKLYSPETCVFISRDINLFIVERDASRGAYPIGVCLIKDSDKFHSSCRSASERKQIYLGVYDTPEEAHAAWLAFKLEQAYILGSQQTDVRVAKALIERYENYSNY